MGLPERPEMGEHFGSASFPVLLQPGGAVVQDTRSALMFKTEQEQVEISSCRPPVSFDLDFLWWESCRDAGVYSEVRVCRRHFQRQMGAVVPSLISEALLEVS